MDAYIRWTAQQERVTLYKAGEVWFLEWFNVDAKYNWDSDMDPNTLIERVIATKSKRRK